MGANYDRELTGVFAIQRTPETPDPNGTILLTRYNYEMFRRNFAQLLPETKDAFDGPILSVSRARISVKCGDADMALRILERSLEISAGITVPELQADPTWDPLRNNPQFQQTLVKHSGAPAK